MKSGLCVNLHGNQSSKPRLKGFLTRRSGKRLFVAVAGPTACLLEQGEGIIFFFSWKRAEKHQKGKRKKQHHPGTLF